MYKAMFVHNNLCTKRIQGQTVEEVKKQIDRLFKEDPKGMWGQLSKNNRLLSRRYYNNTRLLTKAFNGKDAL